jgi:thiamine kinase-like enzyme
LIPPKNKLEEEYAKLKAELSSVGSPIVFCHNDLLLANIIYNTKKNIVTFIDYEYSNYNYQAFDIGNHFAEFAGKTLSVFFIVIEECSPNIHSVHFSRFPAKYISC